MSSAGFTSSNPNISVNASKKQPSDIPAAPGSGSISTATPIIEVKAAEAAYEAEQAILKEQEEANAAE